MAAGIEHLSRGTARAVDRLIIVVEPGRASLDTAQRVRRLAADLGIKDLAIVGNKVCNKAEEEFIRQQTAGLTLLGFIPHDPDLAMLQMQSLPLTGSAIIESAVGDIYRSLLASAAITTDAKET
jgi:CO dehydrogenase maturation factor